MRHEGLLPFLLRSGLGGKLTLGSNLLARCVARQIGRRCFKCLPNLREREAAVP
jgi:hypothetical protein